nr:zinc finger, CCHC-type [Tanacetum cinerariifolium]
SWKDFKHTLKHGKDDLSLVQLGSHLRIEESLREQDSNKGKGKEVGGPSVNMTEEGVLTRNQSWNVESVARLVTSKGNVIVVKRTTQMLMVRERGLRTNSKTKNLVLEKTITLFNVLYVPKLRKNLVSGPMLNKCGYKQVYESDKNQSWNVESVARLVTSKGNVIVVKRTTQMLMVRERGLRTNSKTKVDAIAWWIDFGATTYVCKDHCWFKTYEPVEDGSVYESDKYILSKSGVFVGFRYYSNGHVHYKRMLKMSKDDLISAIDENSEKCTTSPYTPQQNGVAEKKNRALKEMVNSMLSYSGLSEGFWGEAMLTAFYLLNMVLNKRNKATPYELWYKKRPNLSFLTIDKFKARLVIQGFRQTEGIDNFDTSAPVARIIIIRLLLALIAIHNLVIHQMDVKTTFLNGDLDEEVYMKQPKGFVIPGNEHKICAISWASKKQTCITGSTMESEFVALAAAGKEAEWLRNLIHKIPIWPKPITPISIRCDSAPTMARAYSQIYNGKSRHL